MSEDRPPKQAHFTSIYNVHYGLPSYFGNWAGGSISKKGIKWPTYGIFIFNRKKCQILNKNVYILYILERTSILGQLLGLSLKRRNHKSTNQRCRIELIRRPCLLVLLEPLMLGTISASLNRIFQDQQMSKFKVLQSDEHPWTGMKTCLRTLVEKCHRLPSKPRLGKSSRCLFNSLNESHHQEYGKLQEY